MAATTRSILHVLETFQKARITFVQTVADLATKPQNVDVLFQSGVMDLLRPLLLDTVPQIQQTAALGLARLANYSEELAQAVVSHNILPQLISSLKPTQNRYNKKAAASVLKAVARHTMDLAQAVVDSGALENLVLCLEEFDPIVKETAVSALGQIARHSGKLAQAVTDAGSIPFLVLSVQEPELSLRRAAALTLAEIAKHAPELAQIVVDAKTVPLIAPLLTHSDAKLKRQVCYCLSSIAKHSVELAEVVVAADVFPKIFLALKDIDPQVRRNAAIVVREVCKHNVLLAQVVVSNGGAAALVENVADTCGSERLPGVMAIGYIAALDEALASVLIASNGIAPLVDALCNEQEDHIKSASAWSLGQMGRHSPIHATALAESSALPHIVSAFLSPTASEDLQNKCKRALKAIVEHLTHFPSLDALLQGPRLPDSTLKSVLAQLAKLLPSDADARTKFVTSGGFEKLQKLLPLEPGSELKEHIDKINTSYPIEIVHYYSPGYSETLLQKLTGSKASTIAAA